MIPENNINGTIRAETVIKSKDEHMVRTRKLKKIKLPTAYAYYIIRARCIITMEPTTIASTYSLHEVAPGYLSPYYDIKLKALKFQSYNSRSCFEKGKIDDYLMKNKTNLYINLTTDQKSYRIYFRYR